jgi:Leucine-rich repeat (LRR) protein
LIGNNLFETIPSCISGISNLEYLDLYDTPIRNLPVSLEELDHLQKIDLSGIKFSPEFQESWLQRMPEVTWEFDPPCACMR